MNILSKSILLLFSLLASNASQATVRKVFFVGNSYTHTNAMPDMLRDFTTAKGDTIIYNSSAPGGYTFQQHTVFATTISGIFSQPWDIVVLQEQSQLPSFPPAQVVTDVYPFATRLDSFINANDTCTQTMFMMTWGRRNGDVMNCPGYPVVCTYAGMQSRLRDSYMQMTQDNNAIVAPMGSAWKIIIDSFPAIDLYQIDSSHPSVAGSYLQACVFYASIFHRPASGCTYLGGLTSATAQTLQRIADKVVLDSLSQWQQYGHYPYAKHTHTQPTTNTIVFNNQSQRADSYYWSFGDGATSTATNPTHTYTATGVYTVSFTVSNDCFTFTRKDTVHVGVTAGFSGVMNGAQALSLKQDAGGKTTFVLPANSACTLLEVYNCNGSVIRRYTVSSTEITDHFAPGLYLYRAYSTEVGSVFMGKFVAY